MSNIEHGSETSRVLGGENRGKTRRILKWGAAVAGLPAIASLSAVGMLFEGSSNDKSIPGTAGFCGSLSVGGLLPDGTTLSQQQYANAETINSVSNTYGTGATGAVDAITASFTESRLVNVPGGDLDSLGLFQMRPSQGWGTPDQIMDPIFASNEFFRHLTALPKWQSLDPAIAAQAIERSGHPDRYQQWSLAAEKIVATLNGTGVCGNGDGLNGADGLTQLPPGFTLPADTPEPIAIAVRYALGQLGKPYIWGGIGPDGFDCSGLTMEAYKAAGILLPRTTYDQVYAGQSITDLAQLKAGDLIFTEGSDPGPNGEPGHEGIDVGNGWVEDAPHTGAVIGLKPESAWRNFVTIRRILPSIRLNDFRTALPHTKTSASGFISAKSFLWQPTPPQTATLMSIRKSDSPEKIPVGVSSLYPRSTDSQSKDSTRATLVGLRTNDTETLEPFNMLTNSPMLTEKADKKLSHITYNPSRVFAGLNKKIFDMRPTRPTQFVDSILVSPGSNNSESNIFIAMKGVYGDKYQPKIGEPVIVTPLEKPKKERRFPFAITLFPRGVDNQNPKKSERFSRNV